MLLEQIAAQASAAVASTLASPNEIMALAAAAAGAGFIITSSFVKTMVPLRWLAVCSNCGFLAYGLLHPNLVMALLHGTLLPINLYRFSEMLRLTRRVKTASKSSDMSGVWLKPYMKATRCKAGTVLFKKGDPAEHLYFLAEGKIEFVEISQTMGPGRMFGEIAFFAPNNQRTASARCVEDSLVLSMNQRTMKELYYQNPSFGFELVRLLAGRLTADVARLQEQLARNQAPV